MSHKEIIDIISKKDSDINKLHIALFIIRIHINYCLKHKINLYDDPLLRNVLLFR